MIKERKVVMIKITRDLVKEKLQVIERKSDANKKDFGHLLICAGTEGMAGAAVMCGKGAVKSGCGLLTYYVEKEIIPILQVTLPEAMCIDLESDPDLGKYDSVAIGPGLLNKMGPTRLERFVKEFDGPLVIDAESLNVIAKNDHFDDLTERLNNTVLTPHEGEMARMLDIDYRVVRKDRQAAAKQLQKKTGAVVVLKGRNTIVASSGSMMHVNTSGNAGMATGGSGDVLTGMIAALCCQGMNAHDAALCAVYIHGRAGDLAAGKKGMISMTAMDIIEEIPAAFCETLF